MSTTLVLAAGYDSSALTNDPKWKSSGFIVVEVHSMAKAIDEFRMGDFDLVLLGTGLSFKEKERLTCLIRASGSRTPVICMPDASGARSLFADVTIENNPSLLMAGMQELKARIARMHPAQASRYGYAL